MFKKNNQVYIYENIIARAHKFVCNKAVLGIIEVTALKKLLAP